MNEGLQVLLLVVGLLAVACLCVAMAVRMRRKKRPKTMREHFKAVLENEELMKQLRQEAEARLAANAYQFPEPEVADMFLRAGLCNGPQVEALINAGYKTFEAVANAEVADIKKLPKFGPKSAPAAINAARRKLDLPPLPL